MKLYIKSLELINIFDSPTECKSINNSDEKEQIEEKCSSNYYFNEKKKKCEKCDENEFSLFGFTSQNKCFPKKDCTKFDKSIVDLGKCDPGSKTKIIKYDFISSKFCKVNKKDENFLKKEKTVKCEDNYLIADEKCTPGYIFSYNYKLNLSTIKLDDFFDKNNGWYSNEDEIFTGIYNIAGKEKELIKEINITETGAFISFYLELYLQNNEEFKIYLNSNLINKYNSGNIQKSFNISLNLGENIIKFIYIKNSILEPKYTSPVLIKNIMIQGSSQLYTEKILIPCPIGEISSENCDKCIKCQNDLIVDKENNKCVESNININEEKLKECPSFIHEENNKCILNEFLYHKDAKIKINLSPLKRYQKYLCKKKSGYLCYDNYNFIGPIKQNERNKEMKTLNKYNNPIFFISLFESSYLTLSDYSFTEIKKNNLNTNKGHIFALFSPPTKSNALNKEKKDNQNLKITISKSIEKIHLISESLNAFYKSGILIEYSEGEKCLFDNSKNFKAFIYLKCSYNI